MRSERSASAPSARELERRERMLVFEREAWARGVERIAGVDEAGMGPLAGPVVAAAVVFLPGDVVGEADDSKRLDEAARRRIEAAIRERALAVSIGLASVEEIAATNVYQAGLLAMQRAVLGLQPMADHLLVDARRVPGVPMSQEAHVKGDAKSVSIAAASIIAKVKRDAIMDELGACHPGYGFERHRGYSTPEHLAALRVMGPCVAHRTSYEALAEHAGEWSDGYYRLREALREVATPSELEAWIARVQADLNTLSAVELRKLELLARRRAGPKRAASEVTTTLPFH